MEKQFTPEIISELKPNEIFVFGSNLQGHHYGGAARVAHTKFGAEWKVGEGITGQTYAFPTMEEAATITGNKPGEMLVLEDWEIRKSFKLFFKTAEANQDKTFFLTKVGTGVAGIPMENMRLFFLEEYKPEVHTNVIYPKEFDVDYVAPLKDDKEKLV